ncbi:MAG: histidinol-phosphate aminotransferase [Saprospiraceae bacterium]|jgi:histidinol-phosphate aminotransferase
MPDQKEKISFFKKYLAVAEPYKGGKAISEIKTNKDKIYKLSSNENPIGASPKALEAIKNNLENLHLYPDGTDKRLRAALQNFYNNELDEKQFIGASSGSEIIDHIVRAFAGEGLEVIVSNPTFSPYIMFSTWQGSTVVDVPLLEPDYALDVDGIINAITDQTRIIFLTSPNNPTGTYISKQELDRLFTQLPDHVVVVLDEVYYHFTDAEDYTTALPYVQKGYNIIAVNSFSKTYGLAGMRIGYGYTTLEISEYIHQICKPFLIDTLSIEAGIAALGDQEFIDKTVSIVKEGRHYLYKELDRLGVHYWKSQGNFVLIKPRIPAEEFEDKMLMEGVMVRQVAGFGAPGCVRVTVGVREANEAFVAALETIYN